MDHYSALVLAYAVALIGWFAANRILRGIWPLNPAAQVDRPWRETGVALLGVIGVLAVGQLWVRGIRLPETGLVGPVFGTVNQLLIFAPVVLVPAIRRQPWSTAWLGKRKLVVRVLAGAVLSVVAVCVYALLREGADSAWDILRRIWVFDHVDELTQVFLEDVAIAIVFVRLAAAIGRGRAILLVAILFAAGHIPTMVSQGANLRELAALLRDAGLGTAAIFVIQRSRDVVWFWLVHFSMDMTQFDGVTFGS